MCPMCTSGSHPLMVCSDSIYHPAFVELTKYVINLLPRTYNKLLAHCWHRRGKVSTWFTIRTMLSCYPYWMARKVLIYRPSRVVCKGGISGPLGPFNMDNYSTIVRSSLLYLICLKLLLKYSGFLFWQMLNCRRSYIRDRNAGLLGIIWCPCCPRA
jgi:hypothetical protein